VPQRSYVHGISYIDERLLMHDFKQHGPDSDDRPYYYVLDRMYSVWLLLDRAGAIVERYAYDEYGRPLIRESAGRGDMDNDTDMDSTDLARVWDAAGYGASYVWDPRADLDDDGDCDLTDYTLYLTKDDSWPPAGSPTVAQAFSDVGNPFGFQGRVHFALDTDTKATDGTLMLVDNRNRINDPVTGRWTTRDPSPYNGVLLATAVPSDSSFDSRQPRADDELGAMYEAFESNPRKYMDAAGLWCTPCRRSGGPGGGKVCEYCTGCRPDGTVKCRVYSSTLPGTPVGTITTVPCASHTGVLFGCQCSELWPGSMWCCPPGPPPYGLVPCPVIILPYPAPCN
jgi:hypothetical protein